jgi:hypothetical protein
MGTPDFLQAFLWVGILGAVQVNALIFRSRAASLSRADPELAPGFDLIIRGFVRYLTVIILPLLLGALTGFGGRLCRPFTATATTPYDFFCLAVFLVVWFRGLVWALVQDGAAVMAAHSSLYNIWPSSVLGVRLYWVIASTAALAAWLATAAGWGK